MMAHYKIWVTGRVQGVFFRKNAQAEARKLKISGFVRNEPDGRVYMEAEGSDDALEAFLAWCKQGPPLARVRNVQQEAYSESQNHKRFVIAY